MICLNNKRFELMFFCLLPLGDWRVYTRTSDEPGSGTDANITLTIFGTKGDSGPLALGKKGEGSFHPGHTDETKVCCIGMLYSHVQ